MSQPLSPPNLYPFAICDVEGNIVQTGQCKLEDVPLQPVPLNGKIVLGVADFREHYVDPLASEILPLRIMSPTITGMTISSLPPRSTVIIDKFDRYHLEPGESSLSFLFDPGVYEVRVESPTYLPYEAEIEVP